MLSLNGAMATCSDCRDSIGRRCRFHARAEQVVKAGCPLGGISELLDEMSLRLRRINEVAAGREQGSRRTEPGAN